MKKINSIYGLLAILFISFVACKKDEVPAKDLKLDAAEVVISEGESKTINITSGNGDYKVVSSSSDKVSAVVDKNTILITGKKSGTSKLTVSDTKDKKATINVKVTSSLTVGEEKTVILYKGVVKKISILTGEGSYTVNSSNDNVATVELKGSSIEITAVASGEAVITIKDTVTKEEKTISVSVKDLIVSKNEAKVYVGKNEEITVSGSEGFTLSNSDDSVATATASDNKITITAKKVGTTQLTITDSDTEQQMVVNITVTEKVVVKDLTLSNSEAVVSEGKNATISITSGNGNYKVTSSDEAIAPASVNDNTITVTGKKAGIATVKVVDGQSKEVTIKVTVEGAKAQNPNIELNKTEVALKKGEKATVIASNNNENDNYTAESADTKIATVNVSNNNIEITGIAAGKTTITITNTNTNKTATIAVTITDLNVSQTEIITYVGVDKEITVTGTDNYKFINSNDGVVIPRYDFDNKIIIGPRKAGTSVLTVIDKNTNAEVKVNITVEEPKELVLSKYSIEIPRKSFNTDVMIETYKHEPYEFMENGYDVEVTEGQDVIKVEKQHYEGIGHHVKVTSKGKIGTAKFKIIIKETKKEKEVTVTVTPIDLNILIYGNPKSKSLEERTTATVDFKGNGDYKISYSVGGIVTATTIEEEDADHAVLKIVAGENAGKTMITITDSQGLSDQVEVTVTPKPKDFTITEDGVLEAVKPEVIVADMVIPAEVKEINKASIFRDDTTIEKLTMESIKKLGRQVFWGVKKLKEVTMGSQITELGDFVFAFSNNITKVTVKAVNPPTLGRVVFQGTKSNMTLYVPADSVEDYKTSDWAQYFANIEAISAQN